MSIAVEQRPGGSKRKRPASFFCRYCQVPVNRLGKGRPARHGTDKERRFAFKAEECSFNGDFIKSNFGKCIMDERKRLQSCGNRLPRNFFVQRNLNMIRFSLLD